MTQATLLVVNGPNRGTRFRVKSDGPEVVIGRSVGSAVRLDDVEVSRRHAVIRFSDDRFRIHDLDSANGTTVNGQRITEARLRHGDAVRIGLTQLAFQLPVVSDSADSSAHPVEFIDDSAAGQHSAIVQQFASQAASSAAIWPDHRGSLELLYQVAEELVNPIHTRDSLLQRILELTVASVRADSRLRAAEGSGRQRTVTDRVRTTAAGRRSPSADACFPFDHRLRAAARPCRPDLRRAA